MWDSAQIAESKQRLPNTHKNSPNYFQMPKHSNKKPLQLVFHSNTYRNPTIVVWQPGVLDTVLEQLNNNGDMRAYIVSLHVVKHIRPPIRIWLKQQKKPLVLVRGGATVGAKLFKKSLAKNSYRCAAGSSITPYSFWVFAKLFGKQLFLPSFLENSSFCQAFCKTALFAKLFVKSLKIYI